MPFWGISTTRLASLGEAFKGMRLPIPSMRVCGVLALAIVQQQASADDCAMRAALVYEDRGCASQAAHLGPFDGTVDQCAAAAKGDKKCGAFVMWSDEYSYTDSWGCRCCAVGGEAGGDSNKFWDVYSVTACSPSPAPTPAPTTSAPSPRPTPRPTTPAPSPLPTPRPTSPLPVVLGTVAPSPRPRPRPTAPEPEADAVATSSRYVAASTSVAVAAAAVASLSSASSAAAATGWAAALAPGNPYLKVLLLPGAALEVASAVGGGAPEGRRRRLEAGGGGCRVEYLERMTSCFLVVVPVAAMRVQGALTTRRRRLLRFLEQYSRRSGSQLLDAKRGVGATVAAALRSSRRSRLLRSNAAVNLVAFGSVCVVVALALALDARGLAYGAGAESCDDIGGLSAALRVGSHAAAALLLAGAAASLLSATDSSRAAYRSAVATVGACAALALAGAVLALLGARAPPDAFAAYRIVLSVACLAPVGVAAVAVALGALEGAARGRARSPGKPSPLPQSQANRSALDAVLASPEAAALFAEHLLATYRLGAGDGGLQRTF